MCAYPCHYDTLSVSCHGTHARAFTFIPEIPWTGSQLLFYQLYSRAWAALGAAKWSPILINLWERKGNPSMNFLMVIMASDIARGRVRTTTATELRKMTAIIEIIAWQRHAALVYCVLLWYWTSMLSSIDICQNKVFADPYHVTISRVLVYSTSRSLVFWSWLLTKCWFPIRSRAHVDLLVENRTGLFRRRLMLTQD